MKRKKKENTIKKQEINMNKDSYTNDGDIIWMKGMNTIINLNKENENENKNKNKDKKECNTLNNDNNTKENNPKNNNNNIFLSNIPQSQNENDYDYNFEDEILFSPEIKLNEISPVLEDGKKFKKSIYSK
jgi:hypothetical protein